MIDYLFACLPFDNAIVIAFRGDSQPEILYRRFSGPDVFQHLEELYLPAAFLLDPVYHFHLRAGAAGIYRLLDIAPDQFIRSHYYEWYYGRIGITDEVSVLLPLAKDTTLTISMGKDSSSGTMFGARALDDITQHEPLIIALLQRHWAMRPHDPATRPTALPATQPLILGLRETNGIEITSRQAEVALLILQGHSSMSIATLLGIAPTTVKVFRRQLYERCGVSSQAELFAMLFPILGAI
ncbi:MAG: helix-turn-helix transcriptional regulator [Tabrizicola sp.]|nr:helix-turn-helix transcriptional regulator [Tabrizicola sp.]